VKSILVLGLLMGMRHALDADHLAAVASLATRVRSLRATLIQGLAWGIGHTTTLLLVGGGFRLLDSAVPERWARALELGVGVMLLLLGADIFWRMRRDRVHVHLHRHGQDVVHLHAHRHATGKRHAAADHAHSHPEGLPRRAVAVGLVHGLAGSGALLLLALQTAGSAWLGLAYILVFGSGSILGMAALCAVIAAPLQASLHRYAWLYRGLEALVGLTTIGIALRLLYRLGWVPVG
jgi:ABC-type nickel/cobalt efflux system permease component RcnA